jgi:hypothetical protein
MSSGIIPSCNCITEPTFSFSYESDETSTTGNGEPLSRQIEQFRGVLRTPIEYFGGLVRTGVERTWRDLQLLGSNLPMDDAVLVINRFSAGIKILTLWMCSSLVAMIRKCYKMAPNPANPAVLVNFSIARSRNNTDVPLRLARWLDFHASS